MLTVVSRLGAKSYDLGKQSTFKWRKLEHKITCHMNYFYDAPL